MVRSKVIYKFVAEASSRRQTFRKRRAGLFKKASELKALCDTDVGVIIYNNENDELDVWPSVPEANAVLEKFQSSTTMLSSKTKLNQEGQLAHSIEKLGKEVEKEEKKNMNCEIELLMLKYLFDDGDVNYLGDAKDLCLALEKAITLIDHKNETLTQADSARAAPGMQTDKASLKGKEKMLF